ncbi:NEAT domain-containing protein [Mammaliicoccus sciuri]|uniref:NEAT domain-containing protein n=1 Tax=Mammaliicoccus sciuri TaxID=1296 RepID=UPI001952BD89|nr:NEAT domain-containing protein [Mammaliicoccus sciuri]MCD8771232.1 NEAT domain-containing protein [Mammaliicoccus sciuri]MEB6696135.1 NEAT domain-containing protein [Mammaliicoccus sciuri]WQK42766.1 NEAT domain-containing protein [Mammaliicoccus sciuri]WQK71689.1 NEAT domain-containing protein [Mammaliicoccus sciuri]WQK90943.1 NEAT domain-containing protein [Mammaliicoccus sciuri]
MTTQHEHNKNRSTIKKQHHFSIRKLSGGIASIAIGATLFLGAGQTANAMEDKVDTVNEAAATTEDSQSEPVAADDASAAETAEAPAAENVDNETESNDGVTEEIQGSDATDSTDVKADDGTSSGEESEAKEEPDTTDPSKETQVFPEDETLESAVGSDGAADNATTEVTTDKEESAVSEENEAHDFGFIVKKEAEDAKSVMDDYLEHPSKVSHENGKTYVNFTLLNPNWWKIFELYNGDEKLNMTTLEENDDKRVVKVEVPSGVSELTSKVHIVVPFINYDNKYTTRVIFDEAVPDASQVVPEVPKGDAEAPKTEPESPKADAETPKADQDQTSKLREDVKNKEIHNKQVDGEKRPINFKVINPKDNLEIFYYAAMIKDPANIVFDGEQPILELRVDAPSTWGEFDLFDGYKKLDYDVVSFDPENEVATIRVKVNENTKELKVKGTSLIFGKKSEHELGHIVFDKPITKDASNYATADDYKKQKDREKYDKAVTLEDKVRELEKLIDKVSDDEKPQLQEVLKGLKDKLAKELETAVTEFEKAPVTNVDTSKAKDRDFKVLHSSKEDQSHMDFEVEHPAKLVEYNGKKMLAITLKHDSMWKDFQVEGEDGYKRPITISKDSEKDTRTILFPVVEGKDFYNAIIKIHLITPHIEYEGSYHVRMKDLGDAAETAAPEPTPAPSPEPTPSPAPDNKQEPAKDQQPTATPDQKTAPTTDQKQEPTKDQQTTVKPDQKAEPVVNVSTKPTTKPAKEQVNTNKEEQKSVEPVASKDKVESTKQEPNKEKAETESTKQELSKDKATTEQPTEQAKKQENKNELPNTGELDNTQYALFGSLIAGLGSLFFIGRRKTKNSK